MSEGPYDYAAEIVGAEREAQKLGRPISQMDEALERGYVPGES